jgi:hypothetical protein
MSKRSFFELTTTTTEPSSLPLELWTHILSLCGAQSPAHWLVVSKAWLACAHELLYRHCLRHRPWNERASDTNVPNEPAVDITLDNLPHIASPWRMSIASVALFRTLARGRPPPLPLVLAYWQLHCISRAHTNIASPTPSGRMGQCYLVMRRGAEYWLLDASVLKGMFRHYMGDVKLTVNTSIDMLSLPGLNPVRWLELKEVEMPTPDPVVVCSYASKKGPGDLRPFQPHQHRSLPPEMDGATLRAALPYTWYAFVHCDAQRHALRDYLARRHSQVRRQRELGLEIAATLRAFGALS